MSITLYTAPDCIRCKIVKAFLGEKNIAFDTVDFKGDSTTFNAFYRTNRKAIYRNPEGVEFPLFDDGAVIKQGSGEIIAYLLSGRELEACVTRSDMLHGAIAGLYPSQCPAGQETNFLTLVEHLARGGLHVWVQADGRKPDLLEKVLRIKGVSGILNCLGAPDVYTALFGQAPSEADFKASADALRGTADGIIRYFAMPIPNGAGTYAWPTRQQAAEAAAFVYAATRDHSLPYGIMALTPDMPLEMHGLAPVEDALLLKYRSAARESLFKAEKC